MRDDMGAESRPWTTSSLVAEAATAINGKRKAARGCALFVSPRTFCGRHISRAVLPATDVLQPMLEDVDIDAVPAGAGVGPQIRPSEADQGYDFGLHPDEAVVAHLIVEQQILDAGGKLAHRSVYIQQLHTDQVKRRRNYERHRFDGEFFSYTDSGLRKLVADWRNGHLG